MDKGVSAVVALTGVSRRTLDHFHCSGLVPASTDGVGPGSRRRYNPQAVLAVMVVDGMRSAGLPPQVIKPASALVRGLKALPAAGTGRDEPVLVIEGADVRLGKIGMLEAPSEAVWILFRLGAALLKVSRASARTQ